MTSTPVGMRCPECATQRTKVVRLRETPSGPVVTYALIAINVIVFLAEGGGALSISGSPTGSLYEKGSLFGSIPRVPELGVAYGEWWRIVSSGFLHANLLHIAFNMWVLYYLGVMLEPALGRARFGLVYGVSLLCGSFGALLVSPHVPTVGASGAIFGLMGAAAVELRARQIPIFQSGVGGLIVLNLIISFSVPDISWGGHIGGLIGGALCAAVLRLGGRPSPPRAGSRRRGRDRRGGLRGLDRHRPVEQGRDRRRAGRDAAQPGTVSSHLERLSAPAARAARARGAGCAPAAPGRRSAAARAARSRPTRPRPPPARPPGRRAARAYASASACARGAS